MSENRTRSFLRRIALGGPLAGAISMLTGCAVIGDAGDAEPEPTEYIPFKVTICHEPPGNPENGQEINIGDSAVEAHEGHGDSPKPTCGTNELPPASVLMCHISELGFSDVLVDSASIADRLADGDTIGTCSAIMCGGS